MPRKEVVYNSNDKTFVFECPHCNEQIQVLEIELACCIFRHAIYKHNYQQIDPHTSEEVCNKLKEQNTIFGCAKPFQFFKGSEPYVEECDYI